MCSQLSSTSSARLSARCVDEFGQGRLRVGVIESRWRRQSPAPRVRARRRRLRCWPGAQTRRQRRSLAARAAPPRGPDATCPRRRCPASSPDREDCTSSWSRASSSLRPTNDFIGCARLCRGCAAAGRCGRAQPRGDFLGGERRLDPQFLLQDRAAPGVLFQRVLGPALRRQGLDQVAMRRFQPG
jgi:hypothetical protein